MIQGVTMLAIVTSQKNKTQKRKGPFHYRFHPFTKPFSQKRTKCMQGLQTNKFSKGLDWGSGSGQTSNFTCAKLHCNLGRPKLIKVDCWVKRRTYVGLQMCRTKLQGLGRPKIIRFDCSRSESAVTRT